MIVLHSYAVAVALCFVTMLCWGSWANTQKLATKGWRFQLFYWDYAIGVLAFSLLLAFSMGSTGSEGRGFLADLRQADSSALASALLGGAIFNFANILLVAAIDIAGMAVAFPVGVGLALVIGVVTNFISSPVGNPLWLFLGVACVIAAIGFDALISRRVATSTASSSTKGLALAIVAGISMGFFYRFVTASMASDFANPSPGRLTPYSAVVFFSAGLFLSNFLWNSIVMVRPITGPSVPYRDYFTKGSIRLHGVGLLGGIIWNIGMAMSIIASGPAGYAVSYGLGQGATMVASLWGVFVWKEFANAPVGTSKYIALMFLCFVIGLGLIILSRVI